MTSPAFVTPCGLAISSPTGLQSTCSRFLRRATVLKHHSRTASSGPCTEHLRVGSLRETVRCAKGVSFPTKLDGSEFRVGLVSTRWGSEYVNALVSDVKDELLNELGVKKDNLVEMQVPGCFELPVATRYMASAHKVDAIVAVGVLIKGETDHYEYIAQAVSTGIMDVQLSMALPVVFGVLTCQTDEQAKARSIGDESLAKDWAKTAIEMAVLRSTQIGKKATGAKAVGFM